MQHQPAQCQSEGAPWPGQNPFLTVQRPFIEKLSGLSSTRTSNIGHTVFVVSRWAYAPWRSGVEPSKRCISRKGDKDMPPQLSVLPHGPRVDQMARSPKPHRSIHSTDNRSVFIYLFTLLINSKCKSMLQLPQRHESQKWAYTAYCLPINNCLLSDLTGDQQKWEQRATLQHIITKYMTVGDWLQSPHMTKHDPCA